MNTARSGNKVTTDHNGNIIQVRSGAVALQQPSSMAVTVSTQVETAAGNPKFNAAQYAKRKQSIIDRAKKINDSSINFQYNN